MRDEQVLRRGETAPLAHPGHGVVEDAYGPGLPIRFSRSETDLGPPPFLGEHNDASTREVAGYSCRARADLRSRGRHLSGQSAAVVEVSGSLISCADRPRRIDEGFPFEGGGGCASGSRRSRCRSWLRLVRCPPSRGTTATGNGKPKPATLLAPGPRAPALAQRARAEGTLNFYTVPPDASVRRVVEAFTKRWGVRRRGRGSARLRSRTASAPRSAAGNPRRGPDPDLELAVVRRRGAEGLDHRPRNAGIPGWPTGKVPPLYPKKFLTNSRLGRRPAAAVGDHVQQERGLGCRRAEELGGPARLRSGRGRIILTDPTSSPAFVDLWWAVARRNGGMAYLERLRAQAIAAVPRRRAADAGARLRRGGDRGAGRAVDPPAARRPRCPPRHEHAGRHDRPGGRRSASRKDATAPERGPAVRLLPADAGRAGAAQRRPRLDLAVGREDRADGLHARRRERLTEAGRQRSTGRSASTRRRECYRSGSRSYAGGGASCAAASRRSTSSAPLVGALHRRARDLPARRRCSCASSTRTASSISRACGGRSTSPGLTTLIKNTLIVVVGSSAIALVLGGVLAWVNERTDARMGLLSESLPLVPFLLPPIAGATAWVLLLSPGAGFLNVWLRDVLGWFGIERFDGPAQHLLVLRAPARLHGLPGAVRVPADHGRAPQRRPGARGGVARQRTPACCGRCGKVTLPAVMPSIAGAVLLMAWSGFGLVSIPLVIGTGANIHVLSERIVRVLADFPPDEGVAIGLSAIMIVVRRGGVVAQVLVLRRGRFATDRRQGPAGDARSASAAGAGRFAGRSCSATWA